MGKTLYYKKLLWEEYAGNFNIWVDKLMAPIDQVPLELQDGRAIPVGAHVTLLGGKKTSAGYPRVRMLDGCFLLYVGQATSLDGTLALFKQDSTPSHFIAYYYWAKGKRLFFHTPAVAGRCVETSNCEWTVPAEVTNGV